MVSRILKTEIQYLPVVFIQTSLQLFSLSQAEQRFSSLVKVKTLTFVGGKSFAVSCGDTDIDKGFMDVNSTADSVNNF